MTYDIDLTQVLIAIISVTIPILATYASIAMSRIGDKAKLAADDSRREVLKTAAANGMADLQAALVALAEKHGRFTTRNEQVAAVANYVNKTVPDTIKALGVKPEQLEAWLATQLPDVQAAGERAEEAAEARAPSPPPAPSPSLVEYMEATTPPPVTTVTTPSGTPVKAYIRKPARKPAVPKPEPVKAEP